MMKTLYEKFYSKVTKDGPIKDPTLGPCWRWNGATTPEGYGKIGQSHSSTQLRAHRVSWGLHNGDIPAGKEVLHFCDNPNCTRPDHLFLGTQRDNVLDMDRKGRRKMPRGEDHGRAKLTEQEVAEIRIMASLGAKQRDIAKQFGVARSLVGRIVLQQAWAHL